MNELKDEHGRIHKLVTHHSPKSGEETIYHVVIETIGQGVSMFYQVGLNNSTAVVQGHTLENALTNMLQYLDTIEDGQG